MCCSGTRTIIGPLQSAHRNSTATQAIPLTLSGRLLSLQRNYIGRGKFCVAIFWVAQGAASIGNGSSIFSPLIFSSSFASGVTWPSSRVPFALMIETALGLLLLERVECAALAVKPKIRTPLSFVATAASR
jgi:hypothetical protein